MKILKIKTTLDLLCDIEEFTQRILEIGIDEKEAEKSFWKEKYVSVKSIKKHFKDFGRDPEGSLILFLKELDEKDENNN